MIPRCPVRRQRGANVTGDDGNPRDQMVRGVLIDLDGVVYVGNRALPGSFEAIRRIRESGIPFKFITNTTRRPRRWIVSDLARLGLSIVDEDLLTPVALSCDLLARPNLLLLLFD